MMRGKKRFELLFVLWPTLWSGSVEAKEGGSVIGGSLVQLQD